MDIDSHWHSGWLPNVQRAMAVNVGELAAYDQCKRLAQAPFSELLTE